MVAFLALAILLMVAAVAAVVVPLLRTAGGSSPVAAVTAAIVIPAAAILFYASVTNYGWLNRPGSTAGAPTEASSGGAGNADTATPTPTDLGPLRAATSERPTDAQAWLALGLGLVGAEQFKEAKEAFKRAESLGAPGSDARLGFAEAEILENPAMLDGEAGAIVESIINVDPANPKALWYGGMAAIRRGDNAAARSRWQALLAMSPPAPVRHVLEQQLARLDASGGAPSAAPAPASPSAGSSAGLTLAISVDATLKARVPAGAPLFVFARDPDRPGPPVAVVRHSASELPLTVALTDANMMVPGQSLSALERVKLTARVSNRGDPIAAPGDVYGEVLWTRGQPTAPIRIVLNSVVGQP